MIERSSCDNAKSTSMVLFQEGQQSLDSLRFELMVRTMFEVKGKADLEMIKENENLRGSFIELANSFRYGDHLGSREWIFMGISERVSQENLNYFAFGRRRGDFCRQNDPGYRGPVPDSDPYLQELGVYFLRKISGGNGYGEIK